MVFQSRAFMDFVTPLFHKHFPHTKDCTADDFYKVVNRVRPGLIRVEVRRDSSVLGGGVKVDGMHNPGVG